MFAEIHLAEYATPEEHTAHSAFALAVSNFHKVKAEAMRHRLAGRVEEALRSEEIADEYAEWIEREEKKS